VTHGLIKNQAAFECGRLAERMVGGYYAHVAAIGIACDPRAQTLIPEIQSGFIVPVGYVSRKDGTQHAFHYPHFLEQARIILDDLERAWLVGALLAIGDAVSANNYFDRAPELELLRHLRNGVAHGNRFKIDRPANLSKFPAHNKLSWVRSDSKIGFEINPMLQGQKVLFDFMGPGDVLDLLMSIGVYLTRMGHGESLRLL
jgi:hypothetical protein